MRLSQEAELAVSGPAARRLGRAGQQSRGDRGQEG